MEELLSQLNAQVTALTAQVTALLAAHRPAIADSAVYSATEAALLLGVSAPTVYRLAEDGGLPYTLVSSRMRFLGSDLRAWLQARRVAKEAR